MIKDIVICVLISSGFLMMLISTLGILKFKTFLSRLHASGVGETLGVLLMGAAFIVDSGVNFTSAKIILTVAAVFFANPVGTHLISKSALKNSGIEKLREEEKKRKR